MFLKEGLQLLSFFLGSLILVVILSLFYRFLYFYRKDKKWFRRQEVVPLPEDQLRSSELLHHNEAILKIFDLFLKVALAIFGGAAYLISSPERLLATKSLLAQSGWVLLFASVAFALLICTRLRSKVQRFKVAYKFWEPFFWNEPWMVALVVLTGAIYRFFLLPGYLR